ncbi:MAG: hypothetical protein IKN71_06480 [Alphaproteobacteria bacterium]|nr:hypothetical protein [Alphaproteobacteria bacterium]
MKDPFVPPERTTPPALLDRPRTSSTPSVLPQNDEDSMTRSAFSLSEG